MVRRSVAASLLALAAPVGLASCVKSDSIEASPYAGPAPAPTSPAPNGAPDAKPPARSIHHVLGTGQSLAVGALGVPALSDAQPYDNVMFDKGVLCGGTALDAFVPLIETFGPSPVETMSSSFANLVTKLARGAGGRTHDLLVSVHAVGGAPYRLLAKGTAPYADGMAQVKAGLALARSQGIAYEVTAVTTAHGATDHLEKNAGYVADLAQWQLDYETDVHAITGQNGTIPLFHTQYSSFTGYDPTSPIPIAQLRASVENPGKIILVGPRYPLRYGPDGVHLTNEGYRLMGEYHAKAYQRVVVEHRVWEPLRPSEITRAGAIVTVKLLVPAPPLVLDTVRATDPGNLGFEYVDDGPATPTIMKVAIAGADSVEVTLSAVPTGANRRLRYAYTGVLGAKGGLQTGARGNLRDSDATPSRFGFELFNWCVHFDEAVP
jgi:hypothetical protein